MGHVASGSAASGQRREHSTAKDENVIMTETYSAEVLQTREETPSVRSIRLRKPAGFTFQASQAVLLTLNTPVGVTARPFSIASSPVRDYLEFAARRSSSDFKRAFFTLSTGDDVQIRGPRGHFLLRSHAPAVLVAAGIGITPLKSMIEYATDVRLSTPLTLVYGSHSLEEIVFQTDLDALAKANSNLDVVCSVSEPSGRWAGRVGRIDEGLLRETSRDRPDAIYYLAGPPTMVEQLHRAVLAIGIPDARILYEVFRGYA